MTQQDNLAYSFHLSEWDSVLLYGLPNVLYILCTSITQLMQISYSTETAADTSITLHVCREITQQNSIPPSCMLCTV